MAPVSVTADTSHFDRSWLKADAAENMYLMLVTADTSHCDRSWLKADAPENMDLMLVTADTSHFDNSWLKADAHQNMSLILVTAETSQSPIGPCGPWEQSPIGDILIHSSTAPRSSSLDSGLDAAEISVRKYRIV